MALAFERQPKGREKPFAAFSLYLSLGPERSLAKVAAKLSRSKRHTLNSQLPPNSQLSTASYWSHPSHTSPSPNISRLRTASH
jgi:hypothetical protein